MAPKQYAPEEFLSGEMGGDRMSTPPKDRWGSIPPPPLEGPAPQSSPSGPSPTSSPPAPVTSLTRRRSAEGAVQGGAQPRQLNGTGGFLPDAGNGSYDSPPEEENDWDQNSLGSDRSGKRASRSPRTARGVVPIQRTASSPSFHHRSANDGGGGGASLSSSSRSLGRPSRSRSHGAKSSSQSVSSMGGVPFKVFVLLLRPSDKIFELIQVEYDPSSRAKIGDVLDLIPGSATEPKLGSQRHVGFVRTADGAELRDLHQLASPDVFSPDGTTANVSRGEILVAIPEGCTGDKCRQLSEKILKNPKMVRLLRRKDPLKPKNRRGSSLSSLPTSPSGAMGYSSTSSVSSGGSNSRGSPKMGSSSSSVGSLRRRKSRNRIACVPPTVMEEEDSPETPQQQQPQQNDTSLSRLVGDTGAGGAGGLNGAASVSMHSLDTASVRNTSSSRMTAGLAAADRQMDAIAELLSKDNEAERRRRLEEERARAGVEERKRAEAEARARAEAEERIRAEIERKARERRREEEEKKEEERRKEEELRKRIESEEEQRARMSELARRAEMAERAWEEEMRKGEGRSSSDTRSTDSPAGSSLQRNSAVSPARSYPQEIEVPASDPPSNSLGAGSGKAGLEMFVFGMISSAIAVAFAARTINSLHPQVEVVVSPPQEQVFVETAPLSRRQRRHLEQAHAQTQAQVPEQHVPAVEADEVASPGLRPWVAYLIAFLVILPIFVVLLSRTRKGQRFGRRVRNTVRQLRRRIAGAESGGVGDGSANKMRRINSVKSLMATQKSTRSLMAAQGGHQAANATRRQSRSTLAAATQAAAMRSEYGYGSTGGSNWRKAANL